MTEAQPDPDRHAVACYQKGGHRHDEHNDDYSGGHQVTVMAPSAVKIR